MGILSQTRRAFAALPCPPRPQPEGWAGLPARRPLSERRRETDGSGCAKCGPPGCCRIHSLRRRHCCCPSKVVKLLSEAEEGRGREGSCKDHERRTHGSSGDRLYLFMSAPLPSTEGGQLVPDCRSASRQAGRQARRAWNNRRVQVRER